MKISQREMILGVVSLATLLAGGTWYMIDGKLAEHKAKKVEIQKLEQQIRLDHRRVKMQDEWIADLNELQKDLRVFDIKQKSVSPELMKTVNAIAAKHALNITRNQPRGENTTDDLFEMAINCPWEGKLEALVGFLTELQQQGVRYDVRSLNIVPAGQNTGKLKGSMIINCAYTKKAFPETKTAPKAN